MASIVERMIGAASLNANTFEEVEHDASATGQAMTVVILSSVAAGIGVIGSGFTTLLITIVASLIGWFIWAGLTFVIGTKLMPEPQTKSDLGELLRTIGFSTSPGILRIFGFVPILGWMISLAAGLWMLVAMVVAVRQALDYQSTVRAVIVCAIGFVIYMLFSVFLGTLLGGAAVLSGAVG